MINLFTKRKKIALLLLAVWTTNMFAPAIAYALTSGPAQPETQGFQVAGVSDMVDLQLGGLKYNIPLLDIDGYPINLNYQSGSGIDDEASWVGLGWSCNPGAITRQVRGLPDDFSGDMVETDHYVKPKITVGGRLTAKTETFGISNASGSFTFGIFNDNYTGLGAELGVNAGISYSFANDGFLTAGLGAGVLSNTQSGVDADVSPYVCMSVKQNTDMQSSESARLSGSFGYNTRSGLKSLTLGASFSTQGSVEYKGDRIYGGDNYDVAGSTISYNTEPISPSVQIPYTSDYSSFSFDVGGAAVGIFGSVGGTGYKNVRKVQSITNSKPAFGFLYAERGKDNPDAVMDFIRENDNPVIPSLPDLAIPIHMPDIWSYTSQSGGGQFRLYRGGSGAFFDNQLVDGSTTSTLGGDIGVGAWFHGGVTDYKQTASTSTHKWTNNNKYLANGDFQPPNYSNPKAEHVYFRQVGEKNVEDQDMDSQLFGTQALEVATSGTTANSAFRNAGNQHGAAIPVLSQIGKKTRRPNRTVISYLTAAEASQAGIYRTIPYYNFKDSTSYGSLVANQTYNTLNRVTNSPIDSENIRKSHHISEITVTDDGGKRMVYGVPVYNVYQDEYSFAIDPSSRDSSKLVKVPAGISSPMGDPYGIDNYYHKEHKPAYATSYLLSAILSPDYVDKTGNGITDDDLGTAIKFNYSKLPYYYKWRTPYTNSTQNRGLLADPDDDKGTIVYGKKEIWYVQSIESKTKIAYFITGDRRDALGVGGWQNGGKDITNTQKYLKEIRLYSKADMTRPIKVVKFQYTYELCTGIPNSLDAGSPNHSLGGKLTLSKVWFEYGNSDKGKYHPYVFQYNKTTLKYNGPNTPRYAYNTTDRWGIYKPATENKNLLDNEQYPYTNQDTSYTNQNSALWQLKQVALPTGGVINISYESGDYAYVQSQKAMVMNKITSLVANATNYGTDTTRALNANIKGIQVNIGTANLPPAGVDQTAWFKANFLDGSNYVYTKLCISMATNNYNHPNPLSYDFVPTYCQVQSVSINSAGVANIMLTPITEGGVTANPISISAWQRMKNEYPRYAYPGFDNRIQTNNNSVLAAVSAVVNAAKNMSELKKSFYQKANSQGYCSKVLLGNSFIKLAIATGAKIGGPARVKKIQISDTWDATGSPNAASSYGQSYTYTTTENGKTISSGVAAYEPAIGNDENALKQPVPYIENIKGAINNYFDLEMPFCESLYPAPEITYSKVTVTDLDKTGSPQPQTGTIVNEFYTSKDFPVKVTALPILNYSNGPHGSYSLTNSNSDDELCLSQGYSIELNDMNGKTKATTVYNQAGAVISSTVYYYNAQDNGGVMSLNNNVQVVNSSTLQVTSQVLGRDIDFFTDFREQVSSNKGQTINIGVDVFPIFIFPFFALPHIPIHLNNDYKLFRSACAVKVIQNYGILSKVVKTENGSSITTDNLAYDALTGEAVVTRTKNEFNRPIYSTNIPAYWVYNGMGAAYQNLGVSFSSFLTNASGEINPLYYNYLHGGDEVVDTNTGIHYWVIYNQAASGSGNTFKLIDINGNINASYTPVSLVKIVRSGFRNMLTAGATTLVSLNSPITAANYLQLNTSGNLSAMKVINASATTYDESWAGDGNQCPHYINGIVTSNVYSLLVPSNLPSSIPTSTVVQDTDVLIPTDSSYFNTHKHVSNSIVMPKLIDTDSQNVYITGFDTCITINQTKQYNFVLSSNQDLNVWVDDLSNPVTAIGFTDSTNRIVYNICANQQQGYLTAGKHVFFVQLYNVSPNKGTPFFSIELYDNTLPELLSKDTTGSVLKNIFNIHGYANNSNIRSYYGVSKGDYFDIYYHYSYPGESSIQIPACNPLYYPVQISQINPYITGYLGNWRPYQTKVFQQSRNYLFSSNLNSTSVDVKNAGYINNFYSYWYSNAGAWTANPNGSRWVTANTITLYDKYGQQLENKDALGRFSAAKFDFNGELPSAVASNAMNREIYAASLEDNRFMPGDSANSDTCNIREFMQPYTRKTIKQWAVNTIAHSGNYSAQLPADGFTLSTIIDTIHQKTVPYLALDDKNQYITQTTTGLYPNGFEPYPGKKYIFDAWVNDAYPNSKSINITLSINGNNVPLQCKAVVEGWKLIEGTMDLSTLGSATTLNISIVPTAGTVYIDDIRMHPFAAQMKTYAYDDKTMRLMAELDENGFATFYEYDDEGLLIRVKRETEKGIMTLKESRSSYRRNMTP